MKTTSANEEMRQKMRQQVLIVDDDEHVRRMFLDGIRFAGYDCSAAANATQALNFLETTVYIAYESAASKIRKSPSILLETSTFGEKPITRTTEKNARTVPKHLFHEKFSVFSTNEEKITTQIAFVAITMLASLAAVNISPKR